MKEHEMRWGHNKNKNKNKTKTKQNKTPSGPLTFGYTCLLDNLPQGNTRDTDSSQACVSAANHMARLFLIHLHPVLYLHSHMHHTTKGKNKGEGSVPHAIP